MPVTLRYVRPDLGAKLRQLEAETDALHEAAKGAAPAPQRRPLVRLARRLAITAWAYAGRPAYRALGHVYVVLVQAVRSPHVAAVARFIAGWLSDSIRRPLSAFALLLALGLLILLIAPR